VGSSRRSPPHKDPAGFTICESNRSQRVKNVNKEYLNKEVVNRLSVEKYMYSKRRVYIPCTFEQKHTKSGDVVNVLGGVPIYIYIYIYIYMCVCVCVCVWSNGAPMAQYWNIHTLTLCIWSPDLGAECMATPIKESYNMN